MQHKAERVERKRLILTFPGRPSLLASCRWDLQSLSGGLQGGCTKIRCDWLTQHATRVNHNQFKRNNFSREKKRRNQIVTECICTLCLCCCTLCVALSVFFCVWTSLNLLHRCYVLSFGCHKKMWREWAWAKVRGNSNSLSHVPSKRKEETKSETSGCGSFVVPYFQPATSHCLFTKLSFHFVSDPFCCKQNALLTWNLPADCPCWWVHCRYAFQTSGLDSPLHTQIVASQCNCSNKS